MSVILSPSILNADFLNLQQNIELLNKSQADWVHLDIMDGVFVPNITFGQPVVAAIKKVSKKPLDIHLMVVDPDKLIDSFIEAGADLITVHYESCKHLNRTINYIKSKGIKAGVAINPHTPVAVLEEIIRDVDIVLNMTVNPGFGGQKFINNSVEKIKRLKELIIKSNSKALIQIDGGVDLSNIKMLSGIGVDIFVVGSAIFNTGDIITTINKLKG